MKNFHVLLYLVMSNKSLPNAIHHYKLIQKRFAVEFAYEAINKTYYSIPQLKKMIKENSYDK